MNSIVLKASLILLLAGLPTAIAGIGLGVYLVLAGIAAYGLWFASLLLA
ncbi:hypothetical protein [Comamonas badia]|nr:hypothetical protein [Comamonas badia]